MLAAFCPIVLFTRPLDLTSPTDLATPTHSPHWHTGPGSPTWRACTGLALDLICWLPLLDPAISTTTHSLCRDLTSMARQDLTRMASLSLVGISLVFRV